MNNSYQFEKLSGLAPVAWSKEVERSAMEAVMAYERAEGFEPGDVSKPRYLFKPFEQEPDFATASVTFRLKDLMARVQTLNT